MASYKKIISQTKWKTIENLNNGFHCKILVICNRRKLSTIAATSIKFFGGDKSETFANDSKASVLNSEDLLLPLISK